MASNYLELHVRYLVVSKKVVGVEELSALERRVRDLAATYPFAVYYCRKLLTILCHLKVYNLNATAKENDRFVEMLRILIVDSPNKPQILTLDSKIMLLYNSLKVLLGSKVLSRQQEMVLA